MVNKSTPPIFRHPWYKNKYHYLQQQDVLPERAAQRPCEVGDILPTTDCHHEEMEIEEEETQEGLHLKSGEKPDG